MPAYSAYSIFQVETLHCAAAQWPWSSVKGKDLFLNRLSVYVEACAPQGTWQEEHWKRKAIIHVYILYIPHHLFYDTCFAHVINLSLMDNFNTYFHDCTLESVCPPFQSVEFFYCTYTLALWACLLCGLIGGSIPRFSALHVKVSLTLSPKLLCHWWVSVT